MRSGVCGPGVPCGEMSGRSAAVMTMGCPGVNDAGPLAVGAGLEMEASSAVLTAHADAAMPTRIAAAPARSAAVDRRERRIRSVSRGIRCHFPTQRRDHADTVSGAHGAGVPTVLPMRKACRIGGVAVTALSLTVVLVGTVPSVSAGPVEAPRTSVSAAAQESAFARVTPRASATGRQGQRLTVTPTRGLSASGQTITVKGRGFSERVGVYVGLCVIPRSGMKPSPCGGGMDTDGSSQASAWISSNPPAYGLNLAKPYKRGGNFTVRIRVSPRIGTTDCRVVRCAVVARADHMRSNDRTWDVVVPVSFR